MSLIESQKRLFKNPKQMKKKNFLILLLPTLLLAASACCDKPKYANRAEKLSALMHDPNSDYVMVASHRGDWRGFPENSIPAFESAIRMGVDIVEMDVRMTRDSQLVIMHDLTVTRTTDFKPGKEPGCESPYIKDLTLAQLKGLRLLRAQGIATDSLRIPTLAEALICCKDKALVNLDGGTWYLRQVMPVIESLGMTEQVILKDGVSVERMNRRIDRYDKFPMYMPICSGTNLKQIGEYIENGINDATKKPVAFELCFGPDNAASDYVPGASLVRESGARVWMNTIGSGWCGRGNDDDAAVIASDPGEIYGPVIEAGINIIQTDRPALLLDYLRSVGKHD